LELKVENKRLLPIALAQRGLIDSASQPASLISAVAQSVHK
jgi:hypothetical protein